MPSFRVAYQGEPGCYSEAATHRFFGPDVECVPCATFADAIGSLGAAGGAERAVIPVENVLAGTLHGNLDLIVGSGSRIVGEVEVEVRHCLLARVDDSTPPRVARSHEMALLQCSAYLRKHGVRAEVAGDTAGAARELAASATPGAQPVMESGTCAIASEGAAARYGLRVVARGIGNAARNFTRFVVLAPKSESPSPAPPLSVPSPTTQSEESDKASKTSIAFALGQGPGRLCQALSVFAFHDIDLTKIESRHIHSLGGANAYPAHAEARWQYLFYVDFKGRVGEASVDQALTALQFKTSFFRVLGSYRMYDWRRDEVGDTIENLTKTTTMNGH